MEIGNSCNQADALRVTIRVPSIPLLWYFKKLPDLALLFWIFQHKASLTAILYLGDLAVLSLFLMAWQWQPSIQLTVFRLLCHGSHRVLPGEQRPFVSIFRRAPSWRVAISLLACLAVDNRVTCCLCCVSCSLPSLLVFFPRAQSVPGHVARSPWIHLALKREISCVSS